MNTLANKDLFLVAEVAPYFSVTKKTIYKWIGNGTLEGRKIGGVMRIHRDSIIEAQKSTLL